MSLKIRLWAYLGVIHLALAITLVWQRGVLGWWLFPMEIALAVSLLLGLKLVRIALEPLGFARTFSNVIESGEYGSRYARVGHREIDLVIQTYNRMLANLQREWMRLGEQRGFLERFLQVTPVGVVILDFDGRVSLANPRALELLGAGSDRPLQGRTLGAIDSAVAKALDSLAVDEVRMVTDVSGRRLRCQRGEFHDRGFPRSYLLLEELTAELDRTERATYEKLIRLMSHEVTNTVAATNSLLHSCLGYADRIADGEDRADYQGALNVLIDRNRSLNEFTMAFSELVKLPEPQRHAVEVRELLSAMQIMFKAEVEQRGIALVLHVDPDLPTVSMDRNQMDQVMINVVKNAIEAVEDHGRIELVAERRDGYVEIAVVDDGVGLSAESKDALFTPFYTSKSRGQGLGLMLVKEILTQHRFAFSLETVEGRTRFQIRMPAERGGTTGTARISNRGIAGCA